MDMTVINIQLALFFQEPINRPDKLISSINEKLDNLFDSAPIIFPYAEAPIEFPAVQLSSVDKEYNCTISKSRIDFIFNPKSGITDFSNIQDEINKKEKRFIEAVFNSPDITNLNRIGHVIRYFVEDESPSETLKNFYIKKELDNLEELTIRYNQRISVMDYPVNNVTQLITGKKRIGNADVKGFIIEQDINNIKGDGTIEVDFMYEMIEMSSNKFSRRNIEGLFN